jgi:hypothetical protein
MLCKKLCRFAILVDKLFNMRLKIFVTLIIIIYQYHITKCNGNTKKKTTTIIYILIK